VVEFFKQALQFFTQVNKSSWESILFISQKSIKGNGRSESSEEILQSSEGRGILRRCKEVTERMPKGLKLRRGKVVDPES
jgi:hypothetical protein